MTPKEEYEARENIKLFDIGTEVLCACPEKCSNVGIVLSYDFDDGMYNLELGVAFFETARKLTKLDKALK